MEDKKKYFRIIGNEYFNDIKDELINFLNHKMEYILPFFGIKDPAKITIFLYNNKEEFKKSTKYPFDIKPLAGAYSYFAIKIYADLTKVSKKEFLSCIYHEIIHVLYQNYVRDKGLINQTIWFEEGLAQNLSGEKDHLLEKENFKDFLLKNIYSEGKIIPDISYLNKYGNKFGTFKDTETHKYNGYAWSYLMVRYLLEEVDKEKINVIMRNKTERDIIGKFLPSIVYNHYKQKIKTNIR